MRRIKRNPVSVFQRELGIKNLLSSFQNWINAPNADHNTAFQLLLKRTTQEIWEMLDEAFQDIDFTEDNYLFQLDALSEEFPIFKAMSFYLECGTQIPKDLKVKSSALGYLLEKYSPKHTNSDGPSL